jgi:hypothetical protein
MNSPEHTRLELFAALMQLSTLCPQWRMGQTIANLATTIGRHEAGAVWDLEDEEALEAARILLKQYADRNESAVA